MKTCTIVACGQHMRRKSIMAAKKNAASKHPAEAQPAPTLEQRVAVLEQQVESLQATQINGGKVKDWRRTIGMFGDDPVMKEIFDEALRFREKDREKARRKYSRRSAKP
jgi:hypothetical protein